MPSGCCARHRFSPSSSSSRSPSASAPTPRCSASSTACCCRACRSRDADRIVDINEVERRDIGGGGAIAPATFFDWRKMATSYRRDGVFATRIYNVTPTRASRRVCAGRWPRRRSSTCSASSPILGRGFTREDAEPGRGQSIVLSYGFWQRQFAGQPDIINQTVRLNGQPYTVVGVMPATVNFPETSNFWVPAAYDVPSCVGDRTRIRAAARRALPARHRPVEGRDVGPAGERGTDDDLRSTRRSSIPRSRRTSSASRGRCRIGWSDRRGRRCWCCSAPSAACC